MEIIDCVNDFENFYDFLTDDNGKNEYKKEEWKYIWFAQNIIGTTFYDDDMALKWGKLLYKTVKAILERTQSELLESMYEEYLICLNLIGEEKFEWGSSIRYCWFEDYTIEKKIKKIIEDW